MAATDAADWTCEQARAAWKMLGKHLHQLANFGIDCSAIPEPPTELPEAVGRESNRAGVEDGEFVTRFGRLVPGLVAGV